MSRPAERAVPPANEVLERLASLHPKKIDLSLGRIHRLLDRLGNPERCVPPTIHVAGTNGKGSTIAVLRAVLEAAGLRVHAYTSPSLVRFNERIRIGRPGGGRIVDDEMLAAALAECERLNGDEPITFFEITTAAAFLIFTWHPADILLLETGLGGRLDATNVIARPLATVITSISIDHTEYLGSTLPAIAGEKAGILKERVPAIVAHQEREALAVIERAAARLKSPLSVAGENWTTHEEHGRLIYSDPSGLLDLPRPRLFGRHQIENAGLAIATLRAIGSPEIPARAYEEGMVRADWPARMQPLSSGRLIGRLPAGSELWLDGGHNVGGATAIAGAVAELAERAPKPLVLVAGMLATKDMDGFFACFRGLSRRLYAVPVAGENTRKPEEIAAAATRAGFVAESASSIEDALEKIAALPTEAPRVLITGSLYLAGEVLAKNGTPPQ